jgi:hypothetical protein
LSAVTEAAFFEQDDATFESAATVLFAQVSAVAAFAS